MKISLIESMSLDIKYKLSKKLTAIELIKLCATSTEIRKICTLNKFNMIWKDKINEDFNSTYKGEDSYNEYMRLTIFYSTTYWNLLAIDQDEPQNSWSELYTSKEEAMSSFYNKYVVVSKMSDTEYMLNYSSFRKLFDDEDDLIDWSVYKIRLLNIKFSKTHERLDDINIDKMIDDFAKHINLSEDDSEDFTDQVCEIITKLNAYIEDNDKELIDKFVEGICGYFGIDCKLVETFIYNLFLVKI